MFLEAVTNWAQEDSDALLNVFQFVGHIFTMPFYIMDFEVNLFQIIVTAFFIVFLFRFVGALTNSD